MAPSNDGADERTTPGATDPNKDIPSTPEPGTELTTTAPGPAPPATVPPTPAPPSTPAPARARIATPTREDAIDLLRHLYPDLWLNDFDGDAYFGEDPVDDGLVLDITVHLSRAVRRSFGRTAVQEALTFLARRNRRHPLADLLRSLVWDGVERLVHLFRRYFGTDDDPLHQWLGPMWAVGAVSRPLSPGDKLDHTLILIGAQGTGKSTAVELLAMRSEWFNDTPAVQRQLLWRIPRQLFWRVGAGMI